MDKASWTNLAEHFDSLLMWLDPDRDRAAEKFETIRQQLTKMFAWERCMDPEELADETITRVMRRVPELGPDYIGDPRRFFYGVARRVLLEVRRREIKTPLWAEEAMLPEISEDESSERSYDCLDRCLSALQAPDRALILAYYETSKERKLRARELAEQLGVSEAALRVRVHRTKAVLEKCIQQCLEKKE